MASEFPESAAAPERAADAVDAAAVPPGFRVTRWRGGFGNQVGPIYERIGPDGSWARGFLVTDKHTNGMGNCHGGMLMAFADMAFGSAVTYGLHRYWVTVRLVTDFVSAARLGDFVCGDARIEGVLGGFATTRGRIWAGAADPEDPQARLLMTGSGLFKLLGARPGPALRQDGTS